MLRLIIVGALGYLGYKVMGSNRPAGARRGESAVAGGPLSAHATLQRDPDQPPSAEPVGSPTPAAHPA